MPESIPDTLFIPLCAISSWQHNELRYALRSWEMYGPPIKQLLIIGHKPDWLQNVHYLPFNDAQQTKTKNIFDKVKIAASLYDRFIFANDDHFLLQPMYELPYYYSCMLRDFKGGGESFMRYVSNTYKLFPSGKYYDVHTPMIVESYVIDMMTYHRDTIFKSCYGNTAQVEGVEFRDCKINGNIRRDEITRYVEGKPFLSTGEAVPWDLKRWFEEKYPVKSRWEK